MELPVASKCRPSGFSPASDFDWEQFDEQGGKRRRIVTEQDIREALGGCSLDKAGAVQRLRGVTQLGQRACEKALAANGKFAGMLSFDNGSIGVANE